MNIGKKIAAVAAAGTMALGAASPLIANAQVIGGGYGGYGGYGGGCSLPGDFVLGNLFGGAYGNGIVGGTSLGGILEMRQIFCGYGGYGGGYGGFGGYGGGFGGYGGYGGGVYL